MYRFVLYLKYVSVYFFLFEWKLLLDLWEHTDMIFWKISLGEYLCFGICLCFCICFSHTCRCICLWLTLDSAQCMFFWLIHFIIHLSGLKKYYNLLRVELELWLNSCSIFLIIYIQVKTHTDTWILKSSLLNIWPNIRIHILGRELFNTFFVYRLNYQNTVNYSGHYIP